MATPRGAEHRDLEQRLRNIEAQLRQVTGAALRRKQLSVTEGDFVVSGGGNIIIKGADGTPVWDALSGPMAADSVDTENNSLRIATTWTEYGNISVPIPSGYHRGHVLIMASAGHTFTGTGNVSVQPMFFSTPGPAINSGNGDVSVANSFMAHAFSGLGDGTPYPTLDFSLRAIRTGAADPDTGNWHLAASVIFLR